MDELVLSASLPARSPLYAPEPVGLGTGMVESLASYLARLADSHSVSRLDLMAYLATATVDGALVKNHRFYNLTTLRSRELNGMQQVADTWQALLGQHTRYTHLDQLTLLPWRHLVTPRQLTHPSQCWCPSCLEEWLSTAQTVYWPLLWSIRAVTLCPIHRRPLQQQCPRCHAAVPSLAAYEPMGHCRKCQAWLGLREGSGHVQEERYVNQPALQTAQGVLALLAASVPHADEVTLEKLAALLEQVMQKAACHPPTLAAHLGLKPHIVYRLLAREDSISVPTLLGVLMGTGLAIDDFVQKPVAALVSSGRLDPFISGLPSKHKTAQARLQPGQRATPELLAEGRIILETALGEADPPTLKALAQNLGLRTVKVLRRHFPHLCQAILEKRRAQRNRETLRRRLAEILDAADTPASVTAIASQLKTSPVTLHKYFPEAIGLILARRRIISDESALRHQVEAFLAVEPPVSLAEVSRRLGIKTHHIRHHCPDLQHAIIQHFAAYKHHRAVERARQQVAAVREAVATLNAQGQFPRKTKVAVLLGRTSWLRLSKRESEAFSAMMHELGLSPR